jgi:ethanolamine utilization protein EutN
LFRGRTRKWLGASSRADGGRSRASRSSEKERPVELARVIGTVVATQKTENLPTNRFLVIQPLAPSGESKGRPLVAVDLVSAAPEERVFFVRGREAANAMPNAENPVDAAIVGIVDEVRQG